MSIAVKGISRLYGSQLAVNDVSFTVSTGEIVGFIGPNGAGKSTTMKIITGTLVPDRGEVLIREMPVGENLKSIRKIIGYLPENNPLYPEMYIREYLEYVAGLYQISGKQKRNRVAKVIEMTGLTPEVHKKIENLSKGFRQRVGLAQALIHDPEILILDEPTTGLDPNQLMEIRSLISSIGKEKTVLLSTHILQEVEAICDRVIIIKQGNIVADDRSASLKERGAGTFQTIYVELDSPTDPEIWKELSVIQNVKPLEGNQFLLETSEKSDIRGEIFNFAVSQGLTILTLSQKEKSLEEVFREITRD
ncbi:MAG: gliding motility-associated ABC transporter ATP-binding subunit GldA [Bacteroidetes bacterium]|nr:gliding motility-associated ABC transporter ATP-binding subunit GldA [Bacteroidota bacterium]